MFWWSPSNLGSGRVERMLMLVKGWRITLLLHANYGNACQISGNHLNQCLTFGDLYLQFLVPVMHHPAFFCPSVRKCIALSEPPIVARSDLSFSGMIRDLGHFDRENPTIVMAPYTFPNVCMHVSCSSSARGAFCETVDHPLTIRKKV
jgi:hypothetical protein